MINQSHRTKSRFVLGLLAALSLLQLTSAKPAPGFVAQRTHRLNSQAASSSWQIIYFKEINARAKLANLSTLSDSIMQPDDLELRVWIGFGPVALQGFVLKRRGSEWSASYLRSVNPSLALSDYQRVLGTPKSGWNGLWKRLVDRDVLTLPGAPQSGWVDGESFVFEIKTGNFYRTYMYDNPVLSNPPEGPKVIEIVECIRNKFDISK